MKSYSSVKLVLCLFFSCLSASGMAEETAPVINLYFAGDTVLSSGTITRILDTNSGVLFDHVFPECADLLSLNLESPITEGGTKIAKKFNFRMPTDVLTILKVNAVTLVNLANNHLLDYGTEGLLDTIHNLDQVGIYHIGAGADLARARDPVILTIRGKTFGFLGYYGDGWGAAGTTKPGVAPHYKNMMVRDIGRLKKKVDFVVVTVHWGMEKEPQPADWQRYMGHTLIDAGAHIVIGHHPHVLQGIEYYRNGVIAYSLGNFIFSHGPTASSILLHIQVLDARLYATCIPVEFRDLKVRKPHKKRHDTILATIHKRSQALIDKTLPLQINTTH